MESVSTYQKDLIRPGRRVGNTTRQVDFAIQKLFDGQTVQVIDHATIDYEIRVGPDKRLCDLIVERLQLFHNLSVRSGKIEVLIIAQQGLDQIFIRLNLR